MQEDATWANGKDARPGGRGGKQGVRAVQVRGTDARAGDLLLRGLTIKLGPDLRVLYPMNMLNFGIEGELALSGPAHPDHLKLAGTVLCAPTCSIRPPPAV